MNRDRFHHYSPQTRYELNATSKQDWLVYSYLFFLCLFRWKVMHMEEDPVKFGLNDSTSPMSISFHFIEVVFYIVCSIIYLS